jgi:uncharacterized protein YciI
MEYFFYCRDRANTATLREELAEAHWAFMDRYAAAMVARGPTLNADETIMTGSMHIVDLPDAAAAQVFAFMEPYYRAGIFRDVLLHRWRNELGRTMWEFEGDPIHNRRFLIIGRGKPGATPPYDSLRLGFRQFADDSRRRLIACGPLLSDDGVAWVGSALLAELPDRAAVDALLEHDPCAQASLYESVEIHHWRLGGRPTA